MDEPITCRICYDEKKREVTISPCKCTGSIGLVHVSCLKRWLTKSNDNGCSVCGYQFHSDEHRWLRDEKTCMSRAITLTVRVTLLMTFVTIVFKTYHSFC